MARNRIHVLLTFLLIAFVYYPVLTYDFAFSDDYGFYIQTRSPDVMWHTLLMDARYCNIPWILGPFAHATAISGFKYVRILPFLSTFGCALLFSQLIRRWLIRDRLWATAAGCAFAVNPGMLFLTSWVCGSMWTLGAFLALLSISILLGQPKIEPEASVIRGFPAAADRFELAPAIKRSPWAALCLLAAEGTYQPSAMCYWIGVVIWMVSQFDASKAAWRKLCLLFAHFGLVSLVYFGTAKLFITGNSERFALNYNLVRRLGFFITQPLIGSLGYPALQPILVVSVLIGVFLAAGAFRFNQRLSRPWYIPFLIAPLLPAALLPMMVGYQRYDVSRIRLPLYGIIIVFWCVALLAFAHTRRDFLRHRWFALVGTIAATGIGQHHLLHHFIVPQVVEASYVQTQLAEYAKRWPDLRHPLHVLAPLRSNEFSGCVAFDEWGLASSTQPWATTPMTRVLLASLLRRDIAEMKDVPITYTPDPMPADAYVLDLRELRLAR